MRRCNKWEWEGEKSGKVFWPFMFFLWVINTSAKSVTRRETAGYFCEKRYSTSDTTTSNNFKRSSLYEDWTKERGRVRERIFLEFYDFPMGIFCKRHYLWCNLHRATLWRRHHKQFWVLTSVGRWGWEKFQKTEFEEILISESYKRKKLKKSRISIREERKL